MYSPDEGSRRNEASYFLIKSLESTCHAYFLTIYIYNIYIYIYMIYVYIYVNIYIYI